MAVLVGGPGVGGMYKKQGKVRCDNWENCFPRRKDDDDRFCRIQGLIVAPESVRCCVWGRRPARSYAGMLKVCLAGTSFGYM